MARVPNSKTKAPHGGFVFVLLVIAGLLGNYFKLPLFLNVDFIFGSIFAMLAVQMFSLGRATLAAALIASYTVALWNHPYFLMIATTEVVVVGFLFRRYRIGLVLADGLFWVVLGMPLLYLTYHAIMGVPLTNTSLLMCKSAINGITNALLARLLYTWMSSRLRGAQVEYRDLTYNLLAVFAVLPALVLLALNGRADFAAIDQQIRAELQTDSHRLSGSVNIWLENRTASIVQLAAMGATRTPVQMQSPIEQSHASDHNFLRIALINKDAISTAYSPLLDELGNNNIGKNFADRPFIPILKRTLKPVVSEMVLSKVSMHTPTAILAVPVVIGGDYAGYVAGVLSLDQMKALFENGTESESLHYTVIDRNTNIIASTVPGQTLMTPLSRGSGTYNQLGDGIAQWIPAAVAGAPIMERWKSSSYVTETPIGQFAEWKLILEQPVAPFQKVLFARYARSLGLLLVILLVSLVLAEFISHRSIRSLVALIDICIIHDNRY